VFLVTGNPSSSVEKKARVTIARASGDNFLLSIRNLSSGVVATMGETKTGAGAVSLGDGKGQNLRIALAGDSGLFLNDPAGKSVASLGFNPSDKGAGLLRMNGDIRTVDAAGKPIFTVTGNPSSSMDKPPRVSISRATGDNFVLSIRNPSSTVVASIGEGKTGAGAVFASDPTGQNFRTHLVGDVGLTLLTSDKKEIANLGFDPAKKDAGLFRINGELRAVDGAGKPIFTVTDVRASEENAGRVHVGRGAGSNYGIWIRDAGGKVAAAIGEGKTGGGVVTVSDPSGKPRAELFGQGGVTVYNPSGKEVVGLNLDAANTASGVMQLTGIFQILDGGGQTIVDAGRLPTGVGVVRVGPGAKCVPMGTLRVSDCIMGRR
jgi:hypothetical protein